MFGHLRHPFCTQELDPIPSHSDRICSGWTLNQTCLLREGLLRALFSVRMFPGPSPKRFSVYSTMFLLVGYAIRPWPRPVCHPPLASTCSNQGADGLQRSLGLGASLGRASTSWDPTPNGTRTERGDPGLTTTLRTEQRVSLSRTRSL